MERIARRELGRRRFLWASCIAGLAAVGISTGRVSAEEDASSWVKRNPGVNGFKTIASTGDGYAVAGSAKSSATVIGMDEGGREQWTVTESEVKLNSNQAMVVDEDDIVLASRSSLLKLDVGGTRGWRETYTTRAREKVDSNGRIVQLNDGGYVLSYLNHPPESTHSYVVGVSSDGSQRWRQNREGDFHETYSIVSTADGGVIVVGRHWTRHMRGKNGWLMKFDADGTEAWERMLPGMEFRAGVADGEGGCVVVATKDESDELLQVRVDAAGEVVYESEYGDSVLPRVREFVEASDGGYVLLTQPEDDNGNVQLTKTGEEGAIEGEQQYSVESPVKVRSFVEVDDGFLLAGTADPDDERDGYISKVPRLDSESEATLAVPTRTPTETSTETPTDETPGQNDAGGVGVGTIVGGVSAAAILRQLQR